MTLSNVLPVLFIFAVWGIKPGPHTITLLLKTAQSGVRSALLIAFGNNIVHLGFFWVSILALTFLEPSDNFIFWMRLLSGILIIFMSLYEGLVRVTPPEWDKQGKAVSIATGFLVGLSNPLNVSFYVGVMPQIFIHEYTVADIAVMSFLVFCALFAGQLLYIAFADGVKFIFEKESVRILVWRSSNILFGLVGVYFILSAFKLF